MRGTSASSPRCEVSVIVPVYNGESYLPSCLDSLLAQDMPDWEAICINDGSMDSSIDILNRYAARDARIRVVDKANEGVAVARNCGLEAAGGEYVTMLDCDDCLTPGALGDMLEAARRHPAVDMVMAGLSMVYSGEGEYDMGALNYGCSLAGVCAPEVTVVPLYGFAVAKLFKRSVIAAHRLRQMAGLKVGEDMEFALHYLSLCSAVYILPVCVYRYMQHGGNATNAHRSGGHPLSSYIANALSKRDSVKYIGDYWEAGKKQAFAYGCAFLFYREIFRATASNYGKPLRLTALLWLAAGSVPMLMHHLMLADIISAARLALRREPAILEKIKKSLKYRLPLCTRER